EDGAEHGEPVAAEHVGEEDRAVRQGHGRYLLGGHLTSAPRVAAAVSRGLEARESRSPSSADRAGVTSGAPPDSTDPGAATPRPAAPRGSARSGRRALRASLGRAAVATAFPVEAPFVTYSRESDESERIGGSHGDERRPVEGRDVGTLVAPGEARSREPTAGGL